MTKECKKNNQYLKALKEEYENQFVEVKNKLYETYYALETGKLMQVECKLNIMAEMNRNLLKIQDEINTEKAGTCNERNN